MEFEELRRHWHAFGKRDPLWAILTDPEKRNRRWKPEEFFRTGEEEIASVMAYVEALGVPLARRRALDFGCGVGRLTQALCRYFDQCEGVDVAASMIAQAEKYNRHPATCRYAVNAAPDLHGFEDGRFDFIYSKFVLQHMRPEYSQRYAAELVRTLAAGGLLIFQLPGRRAAPRVPGPGQALPEAAFKARIRVEQPIPALRPYAPFTLKVKVKNESPLAWPALGEADGRYQVRLGNHWLGRRGKLFRNDDGRTHLPREVRPDEEVELPLTVVTPPRPGRYVLELDLVQEAVTWFRQKGSPVAQLPVRVTGLAQGLVNVSRALTLRMLVGAASRWRPRMEMYGVNREVVETWIASAGGKVLDVVPDLSAGEDWPGFRYCITKDLSRSPAGPCVHERSAHARPQ